MLREERERERERETERELVEERGGGEERACTCVTVCFSLVSCIGKARKFSLFKKTSSKDDLLSGGSGKFERSSGRGKRKTSKGSSSRDSSLDGLSSDVSKTTNTSSRC